MLDQIKSTADSAGAAAMEKAKNVATTENIIAAAAKVNEVKAQVAPEAEAEAAP